MTLPAGRGPEIVEPANELEQVLSRPARSGTRASVLRALARSVLCVPTEAPPGAELVTVGIGGLLVPCVRDATGRHALAYTSQRQLSRVHAGVGWQEVPTADLFERWPGDVDLWLNPGGQLGGPLPARDLEVVAGLAADLHLDEAYEIGPDDAFTDFPGESLFDPVDCAVALAFDGATDVVEVMRVFRRLDEPGGRTWRVVLVLTDQDNRGDHLAQTVVSAVDEVSDECCDVHVADVRDDDIYLAVADLVRIGVSLWRRDGFVVPGSPEETLGAATPDEWGSDPASGGSE